MVRCGKRIAGWNDRQTWVCGLDGQHRLSPVRIPLLWSVVKGKPVFGPSSMRCGKVGVFPSAS
jgi:hypothetical protein